MPAPAQYGRYRVVASIASGGMADVYAVRAETGPDSGSIYALKIMRPELVSDPRFVSMFFDEARLAAQITSDHVVRIVDLGQDAAEVPYLVMELVFGGSVLQLMKGLHPLAGPVDPVPAAVAIEILAQAALGLHDAHEACDALGTPLDVVHRDVSPQNILVGLDGRARVTDFGVARATARLTKTEAGEVKGKSRYFSPEQAQGLDIDGRSDLFSLAIVGWEMLAARPLFTGRSLADVMAAVMTKPIPDLGARRPDVPPAVLAVLMRALARNRDERQPSAAEFARDLRAAWAASGHPVLDASALGAYVEERVGHTLGGLRALTDPHTEVPEIEEATTVDPELVRRIMAPAVPKTRDSIDLAEPRTEPSAEMPVEAVRALREERVSMTPRVVCKRCQSLVRPDELAYGIEGSESAQTCRKCAASIPPPKLPQPAPSSSVPPPPASPPVPSSLSIHRVAHGLSGLVLVMGLASLALGHPLVPILTFVIALAAAGIVAFSMRPGGTPVRQPMLFAGVCALGASLAVVRVIIELLQRLH